MEKNTVQERPTATTRIIKCTCEHEYQDERYGKKMRLHNKIGKGTCIEGWRCTVCSNVVK